MTRSQWYLSLVACHFFPQKATAKTCTKKNVTVLNDVQEMKKVLFSKKWQKWVTFTAKMDIKAAEDVYTPLGSLALFLIFLSFTLIKTLILKIDKKGNYKKKNV